MDRMVAKCHHISCNIDKMCSHRDESYMRGFLLPLFNREKSRSIKLTLSMYWTCMWAVMDRMVAKCHHISCNIDKMCSHRDESYMRGFLLPLFNREKSRSIRLTLSMYWTCMWAVMDRMVAKCHHISCNIDKMCSHRDESYMRGFPRPLFNRQKSRLIMSTLSMYWTCTVCGRLWIAWWLGVIISLVTSTKCVHTEMKVT
ncbi:hypothetical protein J6590_024702 [Homalodisca vitripennis]|nr:hypothetical protein J6590_024702 [Homalodisca vitripennis]